MTLPLRYRMQNHLDGARTRSTCSKADSDVNAAGKEPGTDTANAAFSLLSLWPAGLSRTAAVAGQHSARDARAFLLLFFMCVQSASDYLCTVTLRLACCRHPHTKLV